MGTGYWDIDAYENNPLCLASGECVDSVIVALPFFHSSTLDESMGMIGLSKIILMEQTMHTRSHWKLRRISYVYCGSDNRLDTILSIKDECGNEVSLTEFDDGTEDFLSRGKCISSILC